MIGDKQITEEMKRKIQDILFESTKQKAREIAIGLSMLVVFVPVEGVQA